MTCSIKVYKKANGNIPLVEFIETLRGRDLADFTGFLSEFMASDDLSQFYVKSIRSKIFEVRYHSFRVLFFFTKTHELIITSAFRKKTNRTPEIELCKTKSFMEDYFIREKKNGWK